MRRPRAPDNEAKRLRALDRYAVLDTPAEPAYDDIARLVAHILEVPIALVSLVDADRQWFKARYGLEPPETPRDISFCGHVVQSEALLLVPDAHADPRFHDNPLVTGEPRVRFYAGAPLRTPDGFVLGAVCGIDHVAREVSSDKLEMLGALARQVISQLELRRHAIEAERLSNLVESSPDCIAVVEPNGALLYANHTLRELLGATSTPSDLSGVYLPESWATLTETGLNTALRDGTWAGEAQMREASGAIRPVLLLLLAELAPDGRRRAVSIHARDISKFKDVERLKNEFVSVVSHELRTPLASIRGSLGLLQGGLTGDLSPESDQLVTVALRNTQRLVRLVNNILDFDRVESGMLEVQREPMDLRRVVEAGVESVHSLLHDSELTLVTEHLGDVRSVGDQDRLAQVVANLLSNAIKFSPAGGEILVRTARTTDGRARVSVHDQGPGISSADQPRLFRRFEQLDASDRRAKGGSGLGLSISKAIVEAMGGSIGVQSTAGEGATFWFELPPPP